MCMAPNGGGSYAYCTEEIATAAVRSAYDAYGQGKGVWPRSTPRQRVQAVEKFMNLLKSKRDILASIIMWEICKNRDDAYKVCRMPLTVSLVYEEQRTRNKQLRLKR